MPGLEIEDIIHGRKFATKSELRSLCRGRMSDSTFYYRLNTLVKNKKLCEVEVKTLWENVILDELGNGEDASIGRVEPAYIWSFEGRLFSEMQQYFEEAVSNRFNFSLKGGEKLWITVSPNKFSKNCKAKIRILPSPLELPSELSLVWQSSQTAVIDINPGERQDVHLFEVMASRYAEKMWGKPLDQVERSLREEEFKYPSERDEAYYKHLLMRRDEYSRGFLMGYYPHLTSLVESEKDQRELLMETIKSKGIALIVFSVYCEDAFDNKLYLLHRSLERNEGAERVSLCYKLYQVTNFTIRGAKGRVEKVLVKN